MPIGIDFGTTNSALATADGGDATLAHYSDGARAWTTFRSVLYFDPRGRQLGGRAEAVAGPRAIERYLDAEQKGRFVQSIKSFLPSRSFTETQIYTHTYTLEDLIALVLKNLVAESGVDVANGPVVLGRPVRFAGAVTEEDEAFALSRLRAAAAAAGIPEVIFEYEPVAAAYEYERRLDHDELVLIGDFGGGTSDFTLVRLGPDVRREGGPKILGNEGVGVAGDVFDSRVVREIVAPMLGRGTSYRSMGKRLELPVWVYHNLERWHFVSFLKSRKTIEMLRGLRAQADEPEAIEALLHLIENDLGFALYRAVDGTKCRLSEEETTELEFYEPPIDMAERISRDQFEDLIRGDVREIADCVDRLLAATGVAPAEVDAVFLTGGSSLVPMVRRYFTRRFGAERLRGGGELTTVAKGLALRAAQG